MLCNIFRCSFCVCVQVEMWLNRVLERMCATLRVEFGEAVQAYEEKPREQWLFDYPAQVILYYIRIRRCVRAGLSQKPAHQIALQEEG